MSVMTYGNVIIKVQKKKKKLNIQVVCIWTML